MQQTLFFLVNLFCAGAFLLFLAIGLLLCFLRRPLASVQIMQKQCGMVFILMALHIIYIYYGQMAGYTDIIRYVGIALIAIDLIAIASVIISVIKCLSNPIVIEEHVQEVEQFAQQVENKKETFPEEAKEEIVVEAEEVVEAKNIVIDNEEAVEVEDSSDEAADVKPLENISIEDLIFFQKVEALMTQKRLFSDPEISRESIAAEIGTNRTYLARSIKNATGKTFLEYITDLRTSYAATLLTTTDHTLDSIGTLVGFRSKSAYYRAFAAAYNCPPSEYRKQSRSNN